MRKTEKFCLERRINPEMLPYLKKKARKNNFALFTYHDDTIITDTRRMNISGMRPG